MAIVTVSTGSGLPFACHFLVSDAIACEYRYCYVNKLSQRNPVCKCIKGWKYIRGMQQTHLRYAYTICFGVFLLPALLYVTGHLWAWTPDGSRERLWLWQEERCIQEYIQDVA